MELEQQFLSLLKIVEDLQKKVIRLEKENQLLIQGQKQLIEWSELNQKDELHFQENIEYELRDALRYPAEDFFPHICSGEVAVEKIIHERKSLARFGDGEFSAIAGRTRHKFQAQIDEGLKRRLLEVLQTEEEELLVGIADNYGSLGKYNEQAKREIRCYLNPAVRKEHLRLLDSERIYYDAYVTRPYVMYADNQTDAPAKRFRNLKRIWDKRDCIFVEGQFTGLGAGNDLFDNAASVKRILGPAENAFTRYHEILDFCLAQNKDDLFCWRWDRRRPYWHMIYAKPGIRRWISGILTWSMSGSKRARDAARRSQGSIIMRSRAGTRLRGLRMRGIGRRSSRSFYNKRVILAISGVSDLEK